MKLKKTIITLIIFIIFNTFLPAYAGADENIIYEKINESIVTKGVTHTRLVRYTRDGWLNINVIKANLSEKYVGVDLLIDPRGVNYMSNVLNMAQQNHAVAAINADFFQRLRGSNEQASPVGTVVTDGKLLSTPPHENGMATIAMDDFKNFFFDYWTPKVIITAPNGQAAIIKHINKYDPLDSIVLYDRNWNTHTAGSFNNIVEVVVENDTVREIRREMPPVEIPESGYILCNLPEYDPFLVENLKVGDHIKLDIISESDFAKFHFAAGGGTLLVKDGKPAPITHNIKGLHPRSAVGINADGKILYLVAVDGRQLSSKGMTLDEMTELLIELGVHNAINFDGGGSTTLVSRSLGDDTPNVVNRVSDGRLRNVTNAIGITTAAPQTDIAGLVIDSVSENVFVNTSQVFSVKAYDKYYNPVNIDMNKIKWSCSGVKGKFKENVFYPESVGHGIIQATYNNIKGTYEIDVLSSPASIEIEPKQINMQTGDKVKLQITGVNRFGYAAPIRLSDVKWEIPDGIAIIEDNTIIAVKSGVGVLKATVDKVSTYAAIAIDFGTVIDDFEKINGSFIPYPSYVEGNYTLSSEQKRGGNYAGKLTFDFTIENGNESKAAYFQLANQGITIPSNATKVGVWVYANSYMEHWLRGGIRDKDGQFHRITFTGKIDWDGWKYIEADIPDDIPQPMRLDRLYVVQINPEIKNKGSIYFDDLSFVYPGNAIANITLPDDIRLPDSLNKAPITTQGDNIFRFSVFGNTLERKTLLDNIVMQKVVNTFNKTSHMSAFVGNIDPKTLEGLKTKFLNTSGYSIFDVKGNTIMHLDDSNDGFRETNPGQWLWFKNSLEKIRSKNVFIFLPKPLTGENGFTDLHEAQLFKDMLTERLAKKGINVFVFYNGPETICNIDRGVRYISTPGIQNIDSDNIVSLIPKYKYVLVTVNGSDVSYEFKNLFE